MSTVFQNETDLKQQTETVHENTKPFKSVNSLNQSPGMKNYFKFHINTVHEHVENFISKSNLNNYNFMRGCSQKLEYQCIPCLYWSVKKELGKFTKIQFIKKQKPFPYQFCQ